MKVQLSLISTMKEKILACVLASIQLDVWIVANTQAENLHLNNGKKYLSLCVSC